MNDRLRRSLWACGSGVGTMLLAIAARDKGMDAIQPWYIAGAAGVVAMFVKAVAYNEE